MDNKKVKQEIKVYKKRYWILFLYSTCAMLNNLQFSKYTSAASIFSCFYNISSSTVNWTSSIFLISSIVLALPSTWFLNRYGLRNSMIIGSALNSICTIIQCIPINSAGFVMIIISQTLSSIAMPILAPIPPKLSSTWFGSKEICRATAVGIIGFQSGSAVGFLITPFFLSYNCYETENIRLGHSQESYILATCNLFLFVFIVLTFNDEPKHPPNPAEATKKKMYNLKNIIMNLLKNKNFVLILISFGIFVGLQNALIVLLNEILIPIYPESEMEIGWIGFFLNITGIIGIIITGHILDRTHKFKTIIMGLCCLTFLSTCFFTGLFALHKMWISAITGVTTGFFLMCFIPAGVETASEITYPNPEIIMSGLIYISSALFGAIFITLESFVNQSYGSLPCNLLFCALSLIGCIISGLIKCNCKRTQQNEFGNMKITEIT